VAFLSVLRVNFAILRASFELDRDKLEVGSLLAVAQINPSEIGLGSHIESHDSTQGPRDTQLKRVASKTVFPFLFSFAFYRKKMGTCALVSQEGPDHPIVLKREVHRDSKR
jgi:hypothetical protein